MGQRKKGWKTGYPVNELFWSIQGEGCHAGQPAVFIRMAGCNLSCPFCDTDHEKYEIMLVEEIVAAAVELMDPSALPSDLMLAPWAVVVITGGEPCLHDLRPLCKALRAAWFSVHLETNGTRPIPPDKYVDWVTVSPKRPYGPAAFVASGAPNEWKFVVTETGLLVDPDEYMALGPGWGWLQPVHGNKVALDMALELIRRDPHKWRLSLQLHKFVGIR